MSKFFEKFKNSRSEKVRNSAFLRRGGYSLLITVIVLAAIILVNFLVSSLSKKVPLEFDMTTDKVNSISDDNKKFIKSVKDEVNIIVCAAESTYSNNLMSYCQQAYNTIGNTIYFDQTVSFINKYGNLNGNLKVKYVDMQSTEFAALSQAYSSLNLAYGDILVTCQKGENEKVKRLSFNDIYTTTDPTGYAAYGQDSYTVSGNKVENALSGAISYVIGEKEYKVGLIKGHSTTDNTATYVSLLKANNCEAVTIDDTVISKLSDDLSAIAIVSPTNDFTSAEIEVISDFLEKGKGLLYIGDAAVPALPNMYEFLSEWGIDIEEGLLFETDSERIPSEKQRSALFSLPTNSSLTENMNGFVTGFNIPIIKGTPVDTEITVTEIASTLETAVTVPVGAGDDYSDYSQSDMKSFCTAIKASKETENGKANIAVLSSVEFIYSDWAENQNISNKDLVLRISENLCGADKSEFSFVEKSLTEETYSNEIDAAGTQRIRIIFMWVLPIVLIVVGIVIYIRRRNAR